MTTGVRAPYSMLVSLFGDPVTAEIFSERAAVSSWLRVERELALTQAELGVIPVAAATSITAAIDQVDHDPDLEALWSATRTVGYPILPLLDAVSDVGGPEVGTYLHWGATTQDIMDTGLVLRVCRGLDRIATLEASLGDIMARLANEHRTTLIAGRTHGLQAVPTTFGAKVAVWLEELARHLERLATTRQRAAVVELFGAGGTLAAMGQHGPQVRAQLAERLGLACTEAPWHTARDTLAEVVFTLASASATCVKVAREIVELSRSEIDEVHESDGRHRGASSTMPQKANPILSEAVIGMGNLAAQHVPSMLIAMQAGHERSAGEWQIEWDAIPAVFALTSGCLTSLATVLGDLQVFPRRMRANLGSDGGMIMAESVMFALAGRIGRARAHDVVYDLCVKARVESVPFREALLAARSELGDDVLEQLDAVLLPEGYIGEAPLVVDRVLERWSRPRPQRAEPT